ncbi:UNVERIFIED_CONTAM: hypothetical protein RMT77_012280 [Armadillidium vulgare]
MNSAASTSHSKRGPFTIQIRIKVAEMSDSMREDAVKQGSIAYQVKGTEDEMAKDLKEFFDSKYYPFWQCIVGLKFGNSITHVSGCFILFSVNDVTFILFKTENGRPWDFDNPTNKEKWRNKCTMFVSSIMRVKKSNTTEPPHFVTEGARAKCPVKLDHNEGTGSEEIGVMNTDTTRVMYEGEEMVI